MANWVFTSPLISALNRASKSPIGFIMNNRIDTLATRREFLKTSALVGGALAAPAILPGTLFANERTDTLKIGLIGCGGRGTGAAGQALNADKNVVLTAMGDAFASQLESSLKTLQKDNGEKVKVTAETSFVGLDAYK